MNPEVAYKICRNPLRFRPVCSRHFYMSFSQAYDKAKKIPSKSSENVSALNVSNSLAYI